MLSDFEHEPTLVTWAELRAQGMTPREISSKQQSGEIAKVAHGLYRPCVGGAPDWRERLAILVADVGTDAVVSRQAAAVLWDLDGFEASNAALSVNLPRRSRVRRVNARRPRWVDAPVTLDGLAVTSAVQTLTEVGAGLTALERWAHDADPIDPVDRVELALECALHRQLVTFEEIADLVDRLPPNRPGRRELAAVLRRRPVGAPPTESYAETRLVQVLRRGGLPDPLRQVVIRDHDGDFVARVDFVIGNLIIEVDGEAWHHDFHADRARIADLMVQGYAVLAFSYSQIEQRPGWVVDRIRSLMGADERAPRRIG